MNIYDSEDEKEDPFLTDKLRNDRRLERLYGANVKTVATSMIRKKKRGRRKQVDQQKTILQKNSKQQQENKEQHEETLLERLARPKIFSKKFMSCSREERLAKECSSLIHCDNSINIQRPWLVGYNNSPTVPPGSLYGFTSRYGYSGALELIRQCSARVRNNNLIDNRANANVDDIIRPNEWGPQLHAASNASQFASPAFWPDMSRSNKGLCSCHSWFDKESTLRSYETKDTSLPLKLKKWIEREAAEWTNVITEAKRERKSRTGGKSKSRKAPVLKQQSSKSIKSDRPSVFILR